MSDLDSPAERRRLLSSIAPEEAAEHHEVLRELLAREVRFREDEDAVDDNHQAGNDYFENLYWCAFLLFQVGDPTDAERLWSAKHTNFDTGSGFDIQFVFGAGTEVTLEHLGSAGRHDIVSDLRKYLPLDPELLEWAQWRRGYFYP